MSVRTAIGLVALAWASLAPPLASAQDDGATATDTTPPAVAILTPGAGATVPTGLIIRASALDDLAVVGVRFFIDGVEIAREGATAPYWAVWDTSGLAEGPHTLTAEASDAAGNRGSAEIPVTVDRTPPAVHVTSPAAGATVSGLVAVSANISENFGLDGVWFGANGVPLGETLAPPHEIAWDTTLVPDGQYTLKVSTRDKAGGLNSSEVTFMVSNGTTRVEETDEAIVYSGTWSQGNAGVRAWSGGTGAIATLTALPARAAVSFNGTGVTWVGFRGPQAGIANVYLDGVQAATVDLYDTVEHVQTVAYRVNGLAPGPHTLIVEATGSHNPRSTDPFVVVDAFITFGTRVEETDGAIVYSGTWAHGNTGIRPWSGGTAAVATLTVFPARAAMSFNGTGVTWVGFRGPQAGIANVYLDGVQAATVDLYDTAEHVQTVAYRVNGLALGLHTLIVEATGSHNPRSTDPFVVVDAFITFE
jgi:hypothetical protein